MPKAKIPTTIHETLTPQQLESQTFFCRPFKASRPLGSNAPAGKAGVKAVNSPSCHPELVAVQLQLTELAPGSSDLQEDPNHNEKKKLNGVFDPLAVLFGSYNP